VVTFGLGVLILLMALPGLSAAEADPSSRGTPQPPESKIRITADRLVADTKTGRAEFIGHVRATQGSTVITSDRLMVLYDQTGKADPAGDTAAAIDTITATGNVVIHFGDKTATTEKAVYQSKIGVFTLTGTGTRVTSGDNVITGEKITVDRKKDRMTVEGGGTSRVNAVIFTGPDGLAQPGLQPGAEPGRKPGE